MPATEAFLDHAAFYVRDIAQHIVFFRDVLGMTVTQLDGPADKPRQAWLLGGIQLIEDPSFSGTEGRFGHLGLICADVPAAIEAALGHGARQTSKGAHWLELPDGLLIELLPDNKQAVQIARGLDPRI
ncbi:MULTISPECIES: VOC family protein [unclassified Rhizobium]|uniref:VOC family protein n=1 Tax=unclassified Rhizobium TaxID=2613769 RepID=UPI00288BCFD1|nr:MULTISPECIES: VOC family protein [unclassified Rhizobium]